MHIKEKFVLIWLLCFLLFSSCASSDDVSLASHVISHRGYPTEAEEHSYEGYDLAIKAGSKNIELDVVMSQDNTLYVSHDITAKRVYGVDRLFSEMMDLEIDELVSPEGNSPLKLIDVIEKYKNQVCFVIELKEDSLEIVDLFCDAISSMGVEGSVIVQCFDSHKLEMVDQKYPEMKKMLLISQLSDMKSSIELPYIDIVCVEKSLITEDNVNFIHDSGREFSAYTLNTAEEIEEAIELGVDNYFTDDTRLALELEEQYRG